MAQKQDLWDKFWKDEDGDVVVYQHPNAPLYVWLGATLVSLFTMGGLSNIFWYIAMIALTVWALLEIFKGVNYLRRTLGGIVLLMVIMSLFKMGY